MKTKHFTLLITKLLFFLQSVAFANDFRSDECNDIRIRCERGCDRINWSAGLVYRKCRTINMCTGRVISTFSESCRDSNGNFIELNEGSQGN